MTIVQDSCIILESQVLSHQQESPSSSMELLSEIGSEKPITNKMNITSFVCREGKINLPMELSTLERQDSCESVGSMYEEGIQADADSESTEGTDSSSENNMDHIQRSGRSSSVVSDASEEGGRDSGIEAEREPDMAIPDEDLMNRIVTQVEFYFSDSNVSKDKFLLKHIRRNKEGYVSLKLVSSFKKIKQLTKDWRVVAHSLTKSSNKIQLNDQGSKIRRIDPLPEIDDTPVTCDILAINLPLEKPNIASVSQMFGACGEIMFIRVVRSGGTIPPDIKSLATKYPVIKDTQFAWIQFDSPEAAKAAVELSDDTLMVVPALPETQKKQEKSVQQKPTQSNSRKNSLNNQQKGQNSRKNSYNKMRKDSSSGYDCENQKRPQRRHAVSMPQTYSPNIQELNVQIEARRRPKSKSCTEFTPMTSGGSLHTSWVQRHLFAAAAASAASAASPVVGSKPPNGRGGRVSQGSLPLPETVIRFPKGPDGSRGFTAESRKRSVTVTEGIPISS